MELIPYTSREGREIVLRHRNALVVRDPASQRLEVRGVALSEYKCPTCHRPLRSSSPERHFDAPPQQESYVDPEYFRMLQAGFDEGQPNVSRQAPPSPIRRLTQPTLPSGGVSGVEDADSVEFISSIPAPQEGARIRRDAFSPNYFQKFFVEERELGRGGKGVVLLVRHEIDGCALGHFACKRVPVGDDHAWLEKVLIEVELLAKLSHPNLVSYRHVWLEDVKLHRFGPRVACAFILQQYCNNGDLLRYVVGEQPAETTKEQLKAQMRRRSKGHTERPQNIYAAQRRLSLEEIYSLFRDITSGLTYLHSANYIHRDLKPSNCLLHAEHGKMTCLISDFGEVQPGNAIRKSTGTTGTISYCAPEVLKVDASGRFGNFTTKSDVFSLGMILYFLCFGRLPYVNSNTVQEELEDIDLLRTEIAAWKGFQDERRERPELPSKLYQLLKKMLALEPDDRPSAAEVLNAMMNGHDLNIGGSRGMPKSMGSSIGLDSRRIHNIDSPMPPSTPQPEPVKPYHSSTTNDEAFGSADVDFSPPTDHSPISTVESSVQKYSGSGAPRHRSQAMALTRSRDRLSPSSQDPARAVETLHPQSVSASQTPLLLPPPEGAVGLKLHHQLMLFNDRHSGSICFAFRFAFFLIKITSVAKACWPFMASLSIGIPLIGVAGLDLGIPSTDRLGPVPGGGSRSHAASNPIRWTWGFGVSAILLVLHFLALWSIPYLRLGSLCAVSRDEWLGW
ncbi:kinase-like protein [Xylariaceae sp. FL0016]|nr:kinase-like protein [Xylariaceae sp. FL0016]